MPPHHHHHGHGGGPFFSWGGGPGWWDYPRSELVVIDQADKSRDKILAYIASLPEKERGKAFAKFFGGAQPTSDVLEELGGMFDEPKGFVLLSGTALVLYMIFRRRPNPSRARRRRYRRRR